MTGAEFYQQQLEQQERLDWAKRWIAGDPAAKRYLLHLHDELNQLRRKPTMYHNDVNQAVDGDKQTLLITESGAYRGIFTLAEKVLSDKGTNGIELTFLSNTGQMARYLTLWTVNSRGEPIYGYKQLCGLMTILKLQTINPTPATIDKWNRDHKKEMPTQVTIFEELMNKPIGVVLQREEYLRGDGTIGEKANLRFFFDPESNATVTEVVNGDQVVGERLKNIVGSIKDKMLPKNLTPPSPVPYAGPPSNGFYPDDIQF